MMVPSHPTDRQSNRPRPSIPPALAWGLIVLLATVMGAGCAKVGDPLPPVVQLPQTIHDLRAGRAPDAVHLFFGIPSNHVRWIEIYRQCDAKTAGDRVNLIARLGWEDLRDSGQPGVFTWDDRDDSVGPNCRYALRFVNDRGLQSEFSNFARP